MHCLCLFYIVANTQTVSLTPAIPYQPGGGVTYALDAVVDVIDHVPGRKQMAFS